MSSPRAKRILPGLLLAFTLIATGSAAATDGSTAPAPSPAATGKAPEASPAKAGRISPSDPTGAAPAPGRTRPATAPSGEKCEPTAAGSGERKAGAVQSCVSISPAPVIPVGRKALAAAPPAAAAAATADSSCVITSPGSWYYTRFGYCITGLTVLYTLKDGNGNPIGTGTLNVATNAALPEQGTKWDERVTVTMTAATGAVTSLTAKFRPTCSDGCKVTKAAPWYGGSLIVGKFHSGLVSYASTPAPGTQVEFTTSYNLYVAMPGAQITDPNASWSNPEKIRCDDNVRDTADPAGTPGPGCVVPSVMPVIKMSTVANAQSSGSAAAAYLWAQNNLSTAWGRDKPLTRAKNGAGDRTGRTCGSAGSKPFQARTDVVPTDSCGEFPFAATHEGGTDGARCAEIIPRHGSNGWAVNVLEGGSGRPCVRAHVPLADAEAAKAQLSESYAAQRVVEAEDFKVEITGSLAEPQGACLNSMPTGARRSGKGWVKNTTEPVPLKNLTNPSGPSGDRAAKAQACLDKTVVKGTEAEGDITGWQDAQVFANAHTPVAGLARCHLIANILGGTGEKEDGGPTNLVPCWQSGLNTGTPSMRSYEFMAQRALKDAADKTLGPNDAILYEVTPNYANSNSTIPGSVTMKARIERADGTSQPFFPDVEITNTQKNTGLLNLGN
ncbi:DNA/RNA non-specific endonuclease [Streptomyces avidinii]|uniref:DNA/RNA non-specific endonuclease n=1 Tax=Streptomyces avidinii TaxID=1895 RepID=UPI0038642222|nr:DNA/RNA non-specific endonuclease [Streptomyces avidinii]